MSMHWFGLPTFSISGKWRLLVTWPWKAAQVIFSFRAYVYMCLDRMMLTRIVKRLMKIKNTKLWFHPWFNLFILFAVVSEAFAFCKVHVHKSFYSHTTNMMQQALMRAYKGCDVIMHKDVAHEHALKRKWDNFYAICSPCFSHEITWQQAVRFEKWCLKGNIEGRFFHCGQFLGRWLAKKLQHATQLCELNIITQVCN